MRHAIVDVSTAPYRLLTSDRPVELFNIKEPNGILSIPLSPTKVFVAANDNATFDKLRRTAPEQLVRDINTFVATRARRFVWAQDESQERFIDNKMSTKMEPTPLLPNIARYEPLSPTTLLADLSGAGHS